MRMSARTLSTAVFGVALLMFSTACGKKKTPVITPQQTQPTGNTGRIGEPPPPITPGARITTFTAEPRTIERGQSATLRVILEPFVPWIWFGGLVVALGAFVSAWPVSHRSARRVGFAVPAPAAVGGAGFAGATMSTTHAPTLPTATS